MTVMRISIIQSDLKWEDKKANLERYSELAATLKGQTDLVVFPEMFSTGFSMAAEKLAEEFNGTTLNWMSALSSEYNFAVCGSFIVKEDGSYYNRFAFVSPSSSPVFYDKRHLFSMGGEDKVYTGGTRRAVFEYMGVRISPYICYDLRFPVWSRNRNDYDLAVYVANWPDARIGVWDVLLRARAIENQCYVAGCNRTGTDGLGLNYPGRSVVINPRGQSIAEAGSEDRIITAEISLSELAEFRQKFNVLRDADDFCLEY